MLLVTRSVSEQVNQHALFLSHRSCSHETLFMDNATPILIIGSMTPADSSASRRGIGIPLFQCLIELFVIAIHIIEKEHVIFLVNHYRGVQDQYRNWLF